MNDVTNAKPHSTEFQSSGGGPSDGAQVATVLVDNGAKYNGVNGNGSVTADAKPSSAVQPDTPILSSSAILNYSETPDRRFPRRRIVLGALLFAAIGVAIYDGPTVVEHYFRFESTDDAFVNGHVTYISPRVAGRVTEVLVENNQHVEAGQVLVRLDREPFQIIVDQKRAALARAKQMVDQQVAALDVATAQLQLARDQARGQLAAVYAQGYLLQSIHTLIEYEVAALKESVANWKLEQTHLELAQSKWQRGKELLPQHAISEEEYDEREASLKSAHEQVDSAALAVQQVRALLGLPANTSADGTPDGTVSNEINESFPGIKYVVASAEQSLAQLGLPVDPAEAKPSSVIEQLGSALSTSFIERVPAVEVASAQLRQAQAALGGPSFDRKHQYNQPAVLQAQKDLDQSELNLSYTEIRAPVSGFVNGRSVNAGSQVQVAQALMSVFPLNDIWIDANFKEGQLSNLRIGQPVDIYVDAYPGHVFAGRVTGFSAGTGAALSLLPPENATGSFVKVVQRLPVRIELTEDVPQDTPLFVGLSVEPEVDLKAEPNGPEAGQRLRGSLAKRPAKTVLQMSAR
ncbi:MAG TPA: efflux RND transporter periplasmic adaptor subunit [Lacipirellulaceae bacterium]|nr:efflux RND transporter periplasmic adaptor subunit [Lacipirellulaceae bacterium]